MIELSLPKDLAATHILNLLPVVAAVLKSSGVWRISDDSQAIFSANVSSLDESSRPLATCRTADTSFQRAQVRVKTRCISDKSLDGKAFLDP